MPINKTLFTRFTGGLIVILILYSAYQLALGDNTNAYAVPRIWRHFFRFAVVLAVYGTGTWGLGKLPQKWLLGIWHLIHTILITTLFLIGLWDWGIAPVSYPVRRLGNSIHEFLISPLLYLATALVGKLSDQASANSPSK